MFLLSLARQVILAESQEPECSAEAVVKTKILSTLVFVASLAADLALPFWGAAHAETVTVEGRGPIPIDRFNCHDFLIAKNPIDRICYDISEGYLLVGINGRYFQYCEVRKDTVDAFLNTPTMAYYKATFEGDDNPYDCRLHRLPSYGQ
jgi:hypothetical protein